MADLNANINVGIETTQALNQLKALQKQISQFHQSVAKSSGQASIAQRDLQRNFLNSVNSIQGFSAELKTVRTTAETFTDSLEKNKFSMRQYFRNAAGASKSFNKNFQKEFSAIERTAIERVKTLQTQYVKMGRDASGAMQAIAIRPAVLNMKDLGTQTAIAAQKQVLFNQLVKQGSTNLLNFGKNTQWAGRQLMVGFTLPLATLGMVATNVFFKMEEAAIKFKKVYGDFFTTEDETKKAMESIVTLGEAYASYGVAVADTLDVAGDAAAAGFAGVDLQNQTAAALKLSVLGQLDLQKALETTIALQNAFQLSSADLSAEIDFLNAVENQTVVALDDITTAIPRVAPVIQALGGDVRDLAFFIAAMKEGGVNAAQGANALKSGLASLINPSEKAAAVLAKMGINIRGIIRDNEGDLAATVTAFAQSLDKLDPLRRAQAIEQLFGKFQFARISALFDNISREGTQASRVLDLAGSSASQLAELAEDELGVSAASSMNKFKKTVEQLKVALVPIGELFAQIATPFVEFGTEMLKAFNRLPDGVKTVIGSVITILGGIGPIALMTFGLINNGIANMIKFFATVRLGYLKITGQAKGVGDETQYMTQEQLEAAAAAASLDQAHAGLTQRFTAEKTAVDQLRTAYEQAVAAGARFATLNPGMMRPVSPTQAQSFAGGGIVAGPGTGTSDSIPAMLSNGEAVIPAKQVKEYAPLIEGMIAGNLPGFAKGVMLGMPKSGKATAKNRETADAIYEEFLKSSYANTPPTEYGHQISPTSGHSFPIFGLGGVYEKGGKRVFVKPVMDETAAMAEIRGTQITRQAHGLQAPDQRIVVIRDPMDPTRERRFLALESDLDAKFIQNEPKALFNEEQYFRQLVASLVRVDKDLAAANVFGDVVADVGPAGVFDRASGIRALKTDLPSMEEQAIVNLLGIKGGAKRAFAESTLALMAGLTPEQYHQRMIGEIQRVLPALKKTVADFGLSNPIEAKAYDAMIKRLETGLGVDWSKFHSIHSAVKVAVPKKPKAVPGYANGVVSVPGQKGKGDVVPAMLSPGEAVIPAEFAKKYAPLINAMVAGNIPGYANGIKTAAGGVASFGGSQVEIASKSSARALQDFYNRLIELGNPIEVVNKMFAELVASGQTVTRENGKFVDITKAQARELAKANSEIKTSKVSDLQLGHLQTPTETLDSGQRRSGSLVRAMIPSQNRALASTTTLEDGTVASGQLVENFARDWNSVTGGLEDTVKLGGAELTEGIRSATQRIDSEIRDLALASAENGRVSDEILEQATNEALKNAAVRGGEDAIAASALEATKEMEVILPATVDTLKDSQALRDAGIKFGNETFEQMVQKLTQEGLLEVVKTSGGTDDYVTTEKGKDLSFTGQAGERFARTRSSGKIQPADRVATGDKSYQDIHGKITASLTPTPENLAQAETAGVEAGKKIKKATADGVRDGLGINSPADEITDVVSEVAEGVRQAKPEVKKAATDLAESVTDPLVTQATKNSARGSSFGNINTKEPIPAVGNPPRQVAQAMAQETAAARTFAGDLKASFANARANITREMGFVREEFTSITQQIKQRFSKGGQEIVAVAQQTNQGLVINGKEYGFNAVAQAQGRDGAIEAIVTKKTAEIIRKATEQYNSGALKITKAVSSGIRDGLPQVEFMGEEISRVLAKKVGQGVSSAPNVAAIPDYAQAGDPAARQGPLPEFSKFEVGFKKLAPTISNATMAFSAISGVVSMVAGQLGPEFQAVAGALSIFSGLMFGLIQATQALISLQLKKKLIDKVEMALKNNNAIVTAISTKFTALFGKAMLGASAAAMGFLIPVGLVVAALALLVGGIFVVNHLLKENEKKIAGLGNAATAAGEKLKLIADLAGFEPTRDPGQTFEEARIGAGADATAEERTTAGAIKESDQFKEAIKKGGILEADLNILKGAGDNAKIALETLTANLIALAPKDADPEKIKAVVLALAAEAGLEEVEVDLPMDLNPFVAGNENAVQDFVSGVANDLAANLDNQITRGMYGIQSLSGSGRSDAQQLGAAAFAGLQQLQTALEAGNLSVDEYDENVASLFANFENFDPLIIAEANKKMMESFGVPPKIADGIKNLEVQKAILEGLSVGVRPSDPDLTALSKIDSGNEKEQAEAEKILASLRAETTVETLAAADAAEKLRQAEVKKKSEVDTSLIEEEINANSIKLEQAKALIASGMDESDAMAIATDEKFAGIFATAKLADEQNKANKITIEGATEVEKAEQAYRDYKNSIDAVTDANNRASYDTWKKGIEDQAASLSKLQEAGIPTALAIGIVGDAAALAAAKFAIGEEKLDEWLEEYKETLALAETFKGAGAAPADPIGEAIKALKQQRQEILNTSKAYSALRKRGMDAAEAMKFAQNPQLMAAMNAGLKVGSQQWSEITRRIQAAEKAAKKFQLATTSGQKQYFDEVYGKVESFFSASQDLMQASFEVATAADNSIISKLENKIKDLNSMIQDYDYALQEIAEKEEEITREYDKKTKALENVKRINEDILRQQRSQLSIADALSQGDIAAAARAVQESREENSRAALDSQGNLLDLAKQAQLESLTAKNGLTREEIEKRIKALKKEISDIERGELAQAQSRIDAAQRKLDIEIKSLTALNKTRDEWVLIKAQTDEAQAGAALYNKELRKSVSLIKEMVAGFKNVPGTVGFQKPAASSGFTPTEKNTRPGPEWDGKPGQIVTGKGGKFDWQWSGGKWNKLAGGGMVKKYAGGGMVKPSYFAGGGKVGYYPMGGLIPYKAKGGIFKSVNTDTQPAMLTPGEFVIKKSAVEKFGVQNLKNINNKTFGSTPSRELVQPVYPEISKNYLSGNIGGGISSNANVAESNTQVDNSVYNYNLSVNVEGTDVSPDQIANVVMRKLQNFGSQRVRGQVIR